MALKHPKELLRQSRAHARAPRQEAEMAKRVGGRQTSGSGNKTEKGDVRLRGVLRVECKSTTRSSYRVTAEDLVKLEDAVFGAGEIPVMQVELLPPAPQLTIGHKFYVVSAGAMEDLLERLTRAA